MDFASLMSAQISKASKPSSSPSTENTTYKSNRDAESAREAAYLAEQARTDASRAAKAAQKRKLALEEAQRDEERKLKKQRLAADLAAAKKAEDEAEEKKRRKRLGLPEVPPSRKAEGEDDDGEDEGDDGATAEEVAERLESMGEPTTLPGEDLAKRKLRYRRARRAAQRDAALQRSRANRDAIPTHLEPVAEIECKVEARVPAAHDRAGRLFLARQITTWFNIVLREWRIALAQRDDKIKESMTGIKAAQSRDVAVQDLRPLFRKLEKLPGEPKELPDDLLKPIADIVRAAQERRYVNANDEYLQVSIGKAAWPIGVTMVGIHERSAREKLHETDSNKAHIMSDESTRKILQSIKRCLSFAQTRWPPEDIAQLMG